MKRLPKQTSLEHHGGSRQGPFLLPQLNKIVFILLLIFAMHVAQAKTKTHLLPPNHPSTAAAPEAAPATVASANSSSADEDTAMWATAKESTSIRENPDANSPVLLDAVAGDAFPVLQTSGDWLQVRAGENQSGWLQAKLATERAMSTEQIQVVQNKPNTHLFWGPDETFGEARRLSAETAFIPERVSGQWIQLAAKEEGQDLWMRTEQAEWISGDPPAKEVWANDVRALSFDTGDRKLPLAGKTIVIDPGHGGKDPGAIATIRPVYERDVNLAAAQVLEQKLKAAGAHVIMTRTANDQYVSLEQRAQISNDNKADIFVSIHQNMYAEDPSVHGTITFYQSANSKDLAKSIETAVTAQLHSQVEKDKVEQEQLYVLSHNLRPAVLVEGCFLSNPQELSESLLTEYQENLAKGIYLGIQAYFDASQPQAH